MKIKYDKNLKIAGIGLVPWSRLGPEKWLSAYQIASWYDWDVRPQAELPLVHALAAQLADMPAIPKQNTYHMLRNKEFQKMLNTQLPEYDLLTYRPIEVPEALSGRTFLMTDSRFTVSFENKVWLRQSFAGQVNFPPHMIVKRDDLPTDQDGFRELLNSRSKIVVQDEMLSGGKGTFLVENFDQYQQVLTQLQTYSSHQRVVVSDVIINAQELSVQGCVTRYGVFAGPLQRQIIAHPQLANANIANSEKFCGIEVRAEDQGSSLHAQATQAVKQLGESLKQAGYKGIFGIDFLLGTDDQLYVLEVNPRITGATPLLTALDSGKGVPFYLLHILELGNYPYEIIDDTVSYEENGALLLLHSLVDSPLHIVGAPESGTYNMQNGGFRRTGSRLRLQPLAHDELVFERYCLQNVQIKPGGRLAVLQFNRPVLDSSNNKLYNDIVETIETVKKQIITKVITGSEYEQ